MLPENVFYYEAFWEVSSDRQVGMGLGGIPFTAIDRYAARYGITDQDRFDAFRRTMRAMDAEYRKLTQPPTPGAPAMAKNAEEAKALLEKINGRGKPGRARRLPKPRKEEA